MDVAIIGAGNVGGALARAFSRAGHSVTITSRTQEKAEAVARESGATVGSSNRKAADRAEVVVVAVPYEALDDVAGEIRDAVDGKVVIETTNRFNPNDPGLGIDGTSAAEQLQHKLPGARVVKAFNAVLGSRLAEPTVDGVEVDGLFAGDDQAAKEEVAELTRAVGLRPLDVGGLGAARALEALANLNISLNMQNGLPWQSGWKLVGPTEASSTAA
ncbi:MAG TPA: NADPH-dependent F420 reductase [Actinomycetota bacterium]|nr:NADPH-dependent F420 reductase [Actinomycetota bacterium]